MVWHGHDQLLAVVEGASRMSPPPTNLATAVTFQVQPCTGIAIDWEHKF